MDEVRIVIEDDDSPDAKSVSADNETLLENISALPAYRTIASPRLESGATQSDDGAFNEIFASSSSDFATVVLLPNEDETGESSSSKAQRTNAEAQAKENENSKQAASTPLDDIIAQITAALWQNNQVQVHYYVKVVVSALLSALLLTIGVPVFMESRVTGSISYTALGIVLVGFGLILAIAVIALLFRPPFKNK